MKGERNRKVSAAVSLACRGILYRNPCGVSTAICMLLVVIWSHVVFYQSTIVHLPTSTALPYDNNVISHHQISTVRTISGQWTPMGYLNASTTPQSSLNWTTADRRLSKTAVERDRTDSRIVIRSNSVVRTDRGILQGSGGRIRDRNGSADWKKRQSRLLTSAKNQSLASTPPTSTFATSSHRLSVSV